MFVLFVGGLAHGLAQHVDANADVVEFESDRLKAGRQSYHRRLWADVDAVHGFEALYVNGFVVPSELEMQVADALERTGFVEAVPSLAPWPLTCRGSADVQDQLIAGVLARSKRRRALRPVPPDAAASSQLEISGNGASFIIDEMTEKDWEEVRREWRRRDQELLRLSTGNAPVRGF